MLKQLAKIVSLFSAKPHRPIEQPETEHFKPAKTKKPIDPKACGLHDAVQSGWFLQQSNELFSGFPVSSNDVVLDVGCGNGAGIMFCAERGAHVIFSDVEPNKVKELAIQVKKTPARISHGIVSNTNPLPLLDRTATRIIAMEMLEHVDNPEEIMRELYRVGQPGALYLITVPDQMSEELQLDFAHPAYWEKPNHIRILQRDEFHKLVTNSGLIVEKQHGYGFFWSMWMYFYWASERNAGRELNEYSQSPMEAPYHPVLQSWATTWHNLISMPEGEKIKQALDNLLPKSQVIVARKPDQNPGRAEQ